MRFCHHLIPYQNLLIGKKCIFSSSSVKFRHVGIYVFRVHMVMEILGILFVIIITNATMDFKNMYRIRATMYCSERSAANLPLKKYFSPEFHVNALEQFFFEK